MQTFHGFGPRGAAAIPATAEATAMAETEGTAAAATPRTAPPPVSTPAALPTLLGFSGVPGEGPPLMWKISGCKPRWKLMGLGGYAHCVSVPATGVVTGGKGGSGAADEGATARWQLLVGCGDRTIRQATIAWPLHAARGGAEVSCTKLTLPYFV